jgi:hypothetical protein
MELDSPKVEQESDEDMVHDRAATTDRESDDETESEDESGNGRRDMPSETARSTPAVARAVDEEAAASEGPPPVRSLPFSRRATRSSVPEKQPSPPTDDGDETEDEEL